MWFCAAKPPSRAKQCRAICDQRAVRTSVMDASLLSTKACTLSTTDLELASMPAMIHAKATTLSCFTDLFLPSSTDLLFEKRELSAFDVVMAELINNRGPAALVRAPAGDSDSRQELLQLNDDLLACGQLLTLTSTAMDIVLLPRRAAVSDGTPFLMFLTRVPGVEYMAGLVHSKRVGLILDLDATLLESEMLVDTRPQDWFRLNWRSDIFLNSAGEDVIGYLAGLPGEGGAESVNALTWVKDNVSHNYRVRVRPGWSQLKACLIQERDKFRTTVCSLGRPVYVQAVTTLLDPAHEVIPREEYAQRVISARPDGTYNCPEKTPAVAVGLIPPNQGDYKMRFAPMLAVDDIPEYYPCAHRDIVYRISRYKPVAQPPSGVDSGEALCTLADTLQQFWVHSYGAQGSGGVIGALKLRTSEWLQKLQDDPIADPAWLLFFEFAFDSTGRNCWLGINLESFCQHQAEQAEMLAQVLGEGTGEAAVDNAELAATEENVSENVAPSQTSSKLETTHAATPSSSLTGAAAQGGGAAAGGLPSLAAAVEEIHLLR